jgi:hypothetical protein
MRLCPQCEKSFVLFDDVCAHCRRENRERERQTLKSRQIRERDPEKYRAERRAYRASRRAETNATAREWWARNPERNHEAYLRYKDKKLALNPNYLREKAYRDSFGVTLQELDAMIAAQGGRCGICGVDQPGGRGGWHLDHDHAFDSKDRRGHRGVLCHRCNLRLGMAGERADLLSQLEAAYVNAHALRLQGEERPTFSLVSPGKRYGGGDLMPDAA